MKQVRALGSGNAFNSDGRGHASFLLTHSADRSLLLDCGATTLYKIKQYKIDISALDLVLLTHFHGDHFAGLPFVLLEMDLLLGRKKELLIAGPPGVTQRCQALLELCYPEYEFSFQISYVPFISDLEIFDFKIKAFRLDHRPESLGYRITGPAGKTVAFSGDTAFNEKLIPLFAGVDLGWLEVSLEKKPVQAVSHVSLEELIAGKEKLTARRLYFSHIYDDLAEKLNERWPGSALEDGQVLFV
jgi:ribonuclease BN (tRNA processing enzyme)